MRGRCLALVTASMLASAPLAAGAQAVNECGEWAGARHLVEPWSDFSATYAQGRIRIALLDTIEPAPAAVHLLILSPPEDEAGARQCRVVSWSAAAGGWPSGFQDLDFAARKAAYDPARGLTLTVPARTIDPDRGTEVASTLKITVNQGTGAISAELAR